MKKTPIAKLIDTIERDHAYFLEFGTGDCPVKVLHKKATELLEEEKQMVVDAYEEGQDSIPCSDTSLIINPPETYFKETFEQ